MNATEALKILEIEKKFPISQEQVKKAYRQKAKENHPDIAGNEDQMKLINEANDWLVNNLDKVNHANLKKDKEKSLNEQIDKITEGFAHAYINTYDKHKRKSLLDSFLVSIETLKQKEKLDLFKEIWQKYENKGL